MTSYVSSATDAALQRLAESPSLALSLKVVSGLAVAYAVSAAAGQWALGNYRRRAWDWSKEIVLITGAGGGLGEAVARSLAGRGIQVVGTDIRVPERPYPPNAVFYELDVTSRDAVREVAAKVRREVGDPTVLVNNAGVALPSTIVNQEEAPLRRTVDVNFVAHFFTTQEFLPAMIRANHGHVVTMSSMAAVVSSVAHAAYAGSKAAALSFHEVLTQELKHRFDAPGVCTSIFFPSWTRTPMLDETLRRNKGSFSQPLLEASVVVDAIVRQIINGRSGHVYLPAGFALVAGIRGWPHALQEIVRSSQAHVLSVFS